jgi:hypothetical protein
MTSPETWNLCIAVLTSVGYKESIARSLIGRQLGEWEEADVVAAYERASGKADPRSYAAGILQRTKKKQRKIQEQMPLASAEPVASREKARAAIRNGKAILRGREPGDE